MFWITRQPINQVIDHPESLPWEQGGHQKQPPQPPWEEMTGSALGGLTV